MVIYSLYGTTSEGCQGGNEEGWFREDGLSVPLMDAELLLPYAPHGTVADGFIHSIPLTIYRSKCCPPSGCLQLGAIRQRKSPVS